MTTPSVANRLRDLADELDGRDVAYELAPVPADQVKVGDVVSWTVGELVVVTKVRVTDRAKPSGEALISMEGEVFPLDPDNYQFRCTSYYADEWVVAKR